MRYHYDKPTNYTSKYGSLYECGHPVYNRCTLFKIANRGLAVIQQKYDESVKHTWWSEIEPWLTDALYLHPDFKKQFDIYAGECVDGIYPTITVRQLMWALKMKPLPRARWETYFDRKGI